MVPIGHDVLEVTSAGARLGPTGRNPANSHRKHFGDAPLATLVPAVGSEREFQAGSHLGLREAEPEPDRSELYSLHVGRILADSVIGHTRSFGWRYTQKAHCTSRKADMLRS